MLASKQPPLLEVTDLRVTYGARREPVTALGGVSLRIETGESLALVGGSGSGKSTLAGAIIGGLNGNARTSGSIRFGGRELVGLNARAWREVRGRGIALIPQEPAAALNPCLRVGTQLREVAIVHRRLTAALANEQARDALAAVRLPDPQRMMAAYPHELSIGQRQRVVIALALIARPSLLLLDEPTTALDVTVAAEVVRLLRSLQRSLSLSLLCISHDLGLVRDLGGRMAVMEAGRIVEDGPVDRLLGQPRHPSTRRLIEAAPSPLDRRARRRPPEIAAPPILRVRELSKRYVPSKLAGWFGRRHGGVTANQRISFDARPAETIAIVGESGCGKSTLARILIGLETASRGEVVFDGSDLANVDVGARTPQQRAGMQMIFQNPGDTLNPRRRVGKQLARAVRKLTAAAPGGRLPIGERVERLLGAVQLASDLGQRLPRELSGGQKQRIAIARALAGRPGLMLADEPFSALDVPVATAIAGVLERIQTKTGMTFLLISHDLAGVRQVADRVMVLYLGRIVELGTADQVYEAPYHPYTEALLSATPVVDPRVDKRDVAIEGMPGSQLTTTAGCPFAPRCPRRLGEICDREFPPPHVVAPGHRIFCHLPIAELARAGPVFSRRA